MKKAFKKAVSILLVAVMVFGAAPLAGFAGLDLPEFNLFSTKAEAATSGNCGEKLRWTLNLTTGELVISGTGAMYDYDEISYDALSTPWNSDRSSIKSVTILDGVTSIGAYAFGDCYWLTNITIPDSVTRIGAYAFGGCNSLTNITIPDSVTRIGDSAFKYCDNLTNITIPDSVTRIGTYAFSYCDGLTSITIPDSVTSIGDNAFRGCTSLTSITIPDSVTSIGDSAFYSCNKLATTYYVGTPEQWRKITIGTDNGNLTKNIVYECNSERPYRDSGACGENLKWKLYPDGELVISGTGAMTDWTSSSSAPWYKYSSSIKSVTIADGVTSIDSSAFSDCTGLTSITVDSSNTAYSSDEYGALFSKNRTELVQYPIGNTSSSYEIPDSVTSIGDYAFYNCSGLTSITIPGSVTSIGINVFNRSNNNLTDVYYTGDLAAWCKIIFDDCSGHPMYYGENLYINGKLLEGDIVIPDGVISIGDSAFYSCDNLTSVTIPDSVTSIGDYAFYDCDSLTSINYLGTSAQWNNVSIGTGSSDMAEKLVIKDNPGLTCLSWGTCGSGLNWKLYSNGELVISGTGSMADYTTYRINSYHHVTSAPWKGYISSIKSVTISDGVTSIGEYAFYNCDSITSITIPDSVTSIGDHAFCGCSSLTSITIPDSVTSIGDSAFSYCDNLTSITIPDSVTSIGDYAFEFCHSLTSITIPDSVTSIGDSAFLGCDSLTSITIPDSVTSIGDSAFYSCGKLATTYYVGALEQWASISIGSGNDSLTENVIYECNSDKPYYGGICGENLVWKKYSDSTELIISGTGAMADYYAIYKNGANVTNAPWNNCVSSIKSVTISDGVTSIGDSAFYGCSSLTSITIPDSVTSIGDHAFCDCSSLTSITIPDSITSIGECAFYNCDSITSITIPDSVTSIGNYAFDDCDNLTSITIPDSVTSIGDSAFCDKLATAYYAGTPEQWASISIGSGNDSLTENVIYECNSDKPYYCGICGENLVWKKYADSTELIISGTGSMADYSTKYKNGANVTTAPWNNCVSSIKSVTISDGVTSIGDYAFYNCDSITSITIPDSVTSIGDYAFSYCDNLTSITIPDSVTTIGDSAFSNSKIENVYYTGSLAEWCAIEFENAKANPMGYANNVYINGDLIKGNFVIPKEITSIGAYAFAGCSDLVTVTLHNGLTSIGKSAFNGCSDLYRVNYPGTIEQWQEVSGSSDNENLEEILVFECNSLNPYYGGYCGENLRWKFHVNGTELLISGTGSMDNFGYTAVASVTTAPWRKRCSEIKKITVADGVTSIGSYAFLNCKNLKSVELPDSLTGIGDYAFWYCYVITKVEIPNGVVTIGEGAFEGCSLITRVAIPKSVTSIEKDAFNECSNIMSVYYAGSKTDWEEIIIYGSNEELTSAMIFYNSAGLDGGSTGEFDNTPDYDSSVTDTLLVPTPTETTISYGDSIVLHVDSTKIPEGGRVEWYPSNGNFSYSVSADGTTCTISPNKSGDTTFTAIVYDAEGNIVSADKQEMTSKAGFFDKIIAFFKKLFGLTKVIPQAFKGTC